MVVIVVTMTVVVRMLFGVVVVGAGRMLILGQCGDFAGERDGIGARGVDAECREGFFDDREAVVRDGIDA